jgi:hypothetical protein
MSTADILAAARGKAAAEPAAPAAKAPAEKSAPPAPKPKAEEPPPAPAPAAKAPAGAVDKKSMTIDQMIAWCREHDAS